MASELDLRVDRALGVPVGTQLSWKIRSLIDEGRLGAGQQLPSIRDLAAEAGVNVNTVRAVYARLERDGVVSSEQGRGTFVVGGGRSDAAARRELRHQIERLEAELVRQPPAPAERRLEPAPRGASGLLSTAELEQVRDELLSRLRELDVARAEVVQRLSALERAEAPEPSGPEPERRSTPSVSGARVRWVGA